MKYIFRIWFTSSSVPLNKLIYTYNINKNMAKKSIENFLIEIIIFEPT